LVGPSDVGSFVSFTPDPTRIRPGPSVAPRIVAAFGLADRIAGTGIGPLEAARSAEPV
jgi:hypothetical protein